MGSKKPSKTEGLGVSITTTLVQVKASLVEQSRTLGKFEVPVVDKFCAGVRLGKKPFAASPGRKLHLRKGAVHGTHRAFCPNPFFSFFSHHIAQDSLNLPVDTQFL
jgi:hypothetical protein